MVASNPCRLNRYAVPKRRLITTNVRCVKPQKGEDLIYTAAEACNHSLKTVICIGLFIQLPAYGMRKRQSAIIPQELRFIHNHRAVLNANLHSLTVL